MKTFLYPISLLSNPNITVMLGASDWSIVGPSKNSDWFVFQDRGN